MGRHCSYLLPKQGGGTSQIQVNKTQYTRTWDALYRLVQKKGTVLLSTSLAWPAVAGCSRAVTFSQLSAISFPQPCTRGRILSGDKYSSLQQSSITSDRHCRSKLKVEPKRQGNSSCPTLAGTLSGVSVVLLSMQKLKLE